MRFILRFNSKVEVFRHIDVFLRYLGLVVLISCDLNLESSKDLAQRTRIVMEERFAKVIKILRGKLHKHFELRLFYFLEYILVVKGAIELRLSFTTRYCRPFLGLN